MKFTFKINKTHNQILLLLLSTLLTINSCSKHPFVYTYNSSNELLLTRKIAIIPCNLFVPNIYSENERIANLTIKTLKDKFQSMNFEIVCGPELNSEIDSLKKEFSNFYDSKTGKSDTSMINKFKRDLTNRIIAKYKVSSVIYPYLLIVSVPVYNSAVRWHGRAYSIFPNDGIGQITALSLYIRINEQNQKLIFDNAGGIQPLVKIGYIDIPTIDIEHVMKDSIDIKKAVEIIIKPILEIVEKTK